MCGRGRVSVKRSRANTETWNMRTGKASAPFQAARSFGLFVRAVALALGQDVVQDDGARDRHIQARRIVGERGAEL